MGIQERYTQLRQRLWERKDFLRPHTFLKRAAHIWPERVALICQDHKITYVELYHQAASLSQQLINRGIGPDAHVLLMYENSIRFYAWYYAILQTGAVVAPLNTYLEQDEVQHIVNDFEASLIVTSETYRDKITTAEPRAEMITDQDVSETQQTDVEIPDRDPDAHAVVLYTSGTTGYPKGVMLSTRNIVINCLQAIAMFDVREHERVCAALPLFHSFMQNACVWSPFIVGASIVVMPKIARSHIYTALGHQPTLLPAIPQLYGLLCRLRHATLDSVKLCVTGGDVLLDKIRMACALRFHRRLCNGYGLTETSPFISLQLEDRATHSSVIGPPAPGIDIDIRDDRGNSLPQGSVGTLWVRGENVMLGYYKAPEETRRVMQDGWFNTGDLAQVTSGGMLMLCGRAKDLIIHKGQNIYPQEIENVLMNHPAVNRAGVLGKKSEGKEWPVAFVAVSHPEQEAKLQEKLRQFCHEHLATYKVPVTFFIRKKLPTTTTGKVNKKKLEEEL